MTLNRQALRQAAFRTQKVYIEALGDHVNLKDFSAAERISVLNQFNVASKADEADQAKHAQDLTARIVQLTLVDELGQRLYGEDELDAMQNELRGEVIDEIGNRASIFAGLATAEDLDDEQESDVKKSKATQKNGGSSD